MAAYILGAARKMKVDGFPRVLSYNVIHTLGVDPDDVVFSGDSTSGNLVIALLRYLSQEGKKMYQFQRRY